MKNRVLRFFQRPDGVYHGSVFYRLNGGVGPSCLALDEQGTLYIGQFEIKGKKRILFILYCIELFCVIMFCIVLSYIVLNYSIALFCVKLYHIVLYCIVWYGKRAIFCF